MTTQTCHTCLYHVPSSVDQGACNAFMTVTSNPREPNTCSQFESKPVPDESIHVSRSTPLPVINFEYSPETTLMRQYLRQELFDRPERYMEIHYPNLLNSNPDELNPDFAWFRAFMNRIESKKRTMRAKLNIVPLKVVLNYRTYPALVRAYRDYLCRFDMNLCPIRRILDLEVIECTNVPEDYIGILMPDEFFQ